MKFENSKIPATSSNGTRKHTTTVAVGYHETLVCFTDLLALYWSTFIKKSQIEFLRWKEGTDSYLNFTFRQIRLFHITL